MPGIAGVIEYGRSSAEADAGAVDAMLKSMSHEPFYVRCQVTEKGLGLSVGWVGMKGGYDDCMPVWNGARDICLIFSGEHFGAPLQIDTAKGQGGPLDSKSAAWLVHLYEEYGEKFFGKLNGWFSGLIIDLRQKKVFLFNDRYGVNRIFWHEKGGRFYFASEAKALLKVLPGLRELDMRSVGEFVSSGAILQERSLFRGVLSLPGGSLVSFTPGSEPRRGVYFKREEWENLPVLGAEEYYGTLKATWQRVLPGYLEGREAAGLSLTGGVDSRMILAWASHSARRLPCYTFSGRYRDCADVSISRRVAGICNQRFETIPIGREFLANFPALCEETVYVSDGAMEVIGAIDLYVQKQARKIAPVRVSGVYGGEILRGLIAFKPESDCGDFFQPEMAQTVRDAAETYAGELKGNRLSFIAFKQAPWFMTAKFSVDRSQVTERTPYFDNELVALAFQTPAEVSNLRTALRLIAEGNPALANVPTDRGLCLNPVPGLTRARHLFQQFTFKAEYAYDYGMPQWLAKMDHVVSPLHLERLFLGRHKFHHFRVFYRDELANYVRQILLDPRALNRPYIRKGELERMVMSHTSGWGNHTTAIHRALSLELVQRKLVEQS